MILSSTNAYYSLRLHSPAHQTINMDSQVKDGQALSVGSHMTRDDHAVLAVRNLVFDLCTQHGGGHGGSAIGMAAVGVALWKYVMRYNPADPEWFDRDRFVLSNGRDTESLSYAKKSAKHYDFLATRPREYVPIHDEPSGRIRCLNDGRVERIRQCQR